MSFFEKGLVRLRSMLPSRSSKDEVFLLMGPVRWDSEPGETHPELFDSSETGLITIQQTGERYPRRSHRKHPVEGFPRFETGMDPQDLQTGLYRRPAIATKSQGLRII